MPTDAPTRCCVLTPVGRGAVATVAIEGSQAVAVVDAHFQAAAPRPLSDQAIDRIIFGRWDGAAGEEVVVCRRTAEQVEIHCHGGLSASTAIVDALQAAGCAVEQMYDWIARHETDPIAADARIALSEARTERTAGILLDQFRGALRLAFTEIERLANSNREDDRIAARVEIDRLLDRASIGMHLTKPWQVVIAGPPNVGKSSLINALVGYNRAIVYDQPGTTRDIVTAQTAFAGWPVQLSDTAGLRMANDPLEAAGVQRAEDLLVSADLVLLVFDGSQPWSERDAEIATSSPHALLVHNKADVISVSGRQLRPTGLWTSAVHGEGLAQLQVAIVNRLVPNPPRANDALPFMNSHIEWLRVLTNKLRGSSPSPPAPLPGGTGARGAEL